MFLGVGLVGEKIIAKRKGVESGGFRKGYRKRDRKLYRRRGWQWGESTRETSKGRAFELTGRVKGN